MIRSLEVSLEVDTKIGKMMLIHSCNLSVSRVRQDSIEVRGKVVKGMVVEKVNQVPKDLRDMTEIDQIVIMMLIKERDIVKEDQIEVVIDRVEEIDPTEVIDKRDLKVLRGMKDLRGMRELRGMNALLETKETIETKGLKAIVDLKEPKNMIEVKDHHKGMDSNVRDKTLKRERIMRVRSNNITRVTGTRNWMNRVNHKERDPLLEGQSTAEAEGPRNNQRVTMIDLI